MSEDAPNCDPDPDQLAAEVEAMALWERHLERATAQWHDGVSQSAEEYRDGLADALGVDPDDVPDEAVENWQAGVMETGAEQFASAITGEGSDWFTGLYESATGDKPPAEVEALAREIRQEALERSDEGATDEALVQTVHELVRERRSNATVDSE